MAKLSGRAPKQIDWVVTDADRGAGDWVGQLFGAGPLLAYDGWTDYCKPFDPATGTCTPASAEVHLGSQRLVRIAGGRGAVVKRGPDAFALVAVGGGRMAVESGDAVDVLAPDGTEITTVPADNGNPPREIALSSTHLAVEHAFTLELYDAATGTSTKSIPLGDAAALRLTGINSKLALLQGPHRMVLVRLGDGKLISLLFLGSTTGVIDPRLTEAGLFQAYNVPRASEKGRIVFEPTATLLTRF